MVCVPFYNSNSEIPYITIIRNTSVRFSNIPRVYSDFVECYCSPHSIFVFLCTFISNRAIRNRDSTITFGKGYWPVNHWPFCNYPLSIYLVPKRKFDTFGGFLSRLHLEPLLILYYYKMLRQHQFRHYSLYFS